MKMESSKDFVGATKRTPDSVLRSGFLENLVCQMLFPSCIPQISSGRLVEKRIWFLVYVESLEALQGCEDCRFAASRKMGDLGES